MSDERLPGANNPHPEPDPKSVAAKYRESSPEVKAQARNLAAKGRETLAADAQPARLAREENDSSGRDKHRHIKDTQQESLIAPVTSGTGPGEQHQAIKQAQAAKAKTAEKGPGEPATTAAKYLKPQEQVMNKAQEGVQKLKEGMGKDSQSEVGIAAPSTERTTSTARSPTPTRSVGIKERGR